MTGRRATRAAAGSRGPEASAAPRTLHVGLRVTDLHQSITFYRKLGYEVVGTVPSTPIGQLVMLKLAGDEFVTLELVANPGAGPVRADGTLHHLVIRVASMHDSFAAFEARALSIDPPTSPDGSGQLLTAWTVDPDGNRIELVQWPAGHPDGMTATDFADGRDT